MKIESSHSKFWKQILFSLSGNWLKIKRVFKSEDTGWFLLLQQKYSKSLSWAENVNKLFTVLGRKFQFSAQDNDLEYLFWRSKNPPVSFDLKPPLVLGRFETNTYRFKPISLSFLSSMHWARFYACKTKIWKSKSRKYCNRVWIIKKFDPDLIWPIITCWFYFDFMCRKQQLYTRL